MKIKWKEIINCLKLRNNSTICNFIQQRIQNPNLITTFPDEFKNITTINNDAFYGCVNMTLTTLPEGLTTIGNKAFYGCRNLAITSIPESVTTITDSAFRGCTGLTSLTFRGTPKYIDQYAFYDCPNLTTINVPWAEGAVAGAPWGAAHATINYNYTE